MRPTLIDDSVGLFLGDHEEEARVIHQAGTEDRAEISPVVKLIVDADQVAAIGANIDESLALVG